MSARNVFLTLLAIFISVGPVQAATIYARGDNGTSLIKIDTATGVATVVGTGGQNDTWPTAFTPDGQLWTILNGQSDAQLGVFDLTTGVVTPVGSPAGKDDVVVLEADWYGDLYAAGYDGSFYRVNKITGQFKRLGNLGFRRNTYIMDMAFDEYGTLWAVADWSSDDDEYIYVTDLYTIDPLSGDGTFQCRFPLIPNSTAKPDDNWQWTTLMGLMFDDVTDTMYATLYDESSFLYRVDPYECEITQIGTGLGVPWPHGGDIMSTKTAPSPIPMLDTWGLAILVLLLGSVAGWYIRRG